MENLKLLTTGSPVIREIISAFNHPIVTMAAQAVLSQRVLQIEAATVVEAILDVINEEKVAVAIIALITTLEILIANIVKSQEQEDLENLEIVIEGWN